MPAPFAKEGELRGLSATTEQYILSLWSREAELVCLPFEHEARNRSFSDLLARLAAERNALVDRYAQDSGKMPRFIILAPAAPRLIEQALFSAFLQSYPKIALLLREAVVDRDRTTAILEAGSQRPDGLQVEICDEQGQLPVWINGGDYIIPFDDGDVLHPALACSLALLSLASDHPPPDVWSWNATCYSSSGDDICALATGFIRRPAGPNLSWLSGDVVGRSFALRADTFRKYFSEGVGAFRTDGLAMRTLRLGMAGVSWRHHPEYLGLYRTTGPDALLESRYGCQEELQELRRYAAQKLPGMEIEECQRTTGVFGKREPQIRPKSVGDGISVIIPFRDKVDLTLKAVASIASQTVETWIEIILVNNQSQPIELDRLRCGLDLIGRAGLQARVIDYPRPFNHSRQCNLGARVASGETLVFLNNDATLESPTALDVMARWAGVPGVATVGARIVGPTGELQCAGLTVRQHLGCEYNSPIEESRNPLFSTGLREVVGNSFACAAMRRRRFLDLGGLDEVCFPIGYNDVEFCLRAVHRGYRHLLTGWVSVVHMPGRSRGRSDEILQKVLIRDRYPEVVRYSQFQLESDTDTLKLSVAKSMAPAATAKPFLLVQSFWKSALKVVPGGVSRGLRRGKD